MMMWLVNNLGCKTGRGQEPCQLKPKVSKIEVGNFTKVHKINEISNQTSLKEANKITQNNFKYYETRVQIMKKAGTNSVKDTNKRTYDIFITN